MKAILKFDLNDPDDRRDYKLHNQTHMMFSALWDMSQYLRDQYKSSQGEEFVAIEKIKNHFHQILSDYSVDLDL